MAQPNPQGSMGAGGWQGQQGGDDWGNSAAEDAGLMSWDEIAMSADAEEAQADPLNAALSDFEKIQKAQEKAAEQSKSNPLLIIVGVLAIAGLAAFILIPTGGGKSKEGDGRIQVQNDPPQIKWTGGDIDCVGKPNCEAQALQAYRVGHDICEKLDSAVGNRYECIMQLTKAEALLEKGGIEKTPDEMKGYTELRDQVSADLKRRFQQLRANIHSDKKLKMWGNVAKKLRQVKATFPDKRCNYHQWALEKERELKEQGNYPRNFTP
jgi:hypothetical protein